MNRWFDVGKGILIGYFAGGLLGIATATFIGTACIALGVDSFHLGLGPIPLMEAYARSDASGFSTGWGIWIFATVGGVVGGLQELRRARPAA